MGSLIWSVIKAMFGSVADAWNRYQDRKKIEHETQMAIELGKQKMIVKQLEFENKLSLAQLKATPRWFKVFTFMAWFLPYIVIIIAPSWGIEIFNNLKGAPLWYVQTAQVLLFAVWGISVGKDTIASIFSNIASAWSSKRQPPIIVKAADFDVDGLLKEYSKRFKGVSSRHLDILREIIEKVDRRDEE